MVPEFWQALQACIRQDPLAIRSSSETAMPDSVQETVAVALRVQAQLPKRLCSDCASCSAQSSSPCADASCWTESAEGSAGFL